VSGDTAAADHQELNRARTIGLSRFTSGSQLFATLEGTTGFATSF